MSTIINENVVTWWEKFCNKYGDEEELQEIFKKVEETDKDTTEESIEEIRKMLSSFGGKAYSEVRENFNRKIKIFENRISRQVSRDLGKTLKFLREEKKYSLARLEELTGISGSYLNRLELGERKAPSYPILEKIANAYGISPQSLLNIATSEEVTEAPSVAEVLYSNEISFSDDKTPVNLATKKQLIDIINHILDMDWQENKHTEMLELLEMIDRFK